jgi:hypothetical protein
MVGVFIYIWSMMHCVLLRLHILYCTIVYNTYCIPVVSRKGFLLGFTLVHRHFISVCYVSATKRIGIKRIAALPIGLKRIGS